MKLRTILIVLSLLLGSTMVMPVVTGQSMAEEVVYIRTDGTVYPTAPIKRDGDMYTIIFDISKAIVVQRDSVVIDGNGYVLQGDGKGIGFDLSNRKNVTIKSLHIIGFGYGAYLSQSIGNKIINNTITNCVYGIVSDRSPGNTLSNNFVFENSWDGIFVTYSDGIVLSDNVIANHSKWGLYLGSSIGTVLKNNSITGNRWNFGVSNKYVHDIDASNTVDGKPIYYFVNQHHKQVPPNAGYVAAIDCTNISVRNLSLTNNGQGVVLVNSRECLVSNSLITRMGYYAIQLVDSDNNTISNNEIRDNRPPYFGVGIAIQSQSTGNIIIKNTIQNNELGIFSYNSDGNRIYLNNFLGNVIQASSESSKNNWNNGYDVGGNYWNNYRGSDFFSGPYQNITGGDGIGDTPQIIDANNKDNYPLMNPWVPTLAVIDATIDIHPNPLNLKSRGKWITAYIELPEDHRASEINRATILLNASIPVDPFWDAKPLDSVIGDYDDNGISDLMVKFDRKVFSEFISEDDSLGKVTLTISGKLSNGTFFEGGATVETLKPYEAVCHNELANVKDHVVP